MTGAAGDVTLRIHPTALAVRETGPWLLGALAALPAEEATALHARFDLAVHEVAMNIVDHANLKPGETILFALDVGTGAARITVTDDGDSFNAAEVREPVAGVPQIRGYGLMIVRKLVDELSYDRVGEQNRWTLRINRSTTETSTP